MKNQRQDRCPPKTQACSRPPRAVPPPSNVGQKLRVETTKPQKLDIQWPPKMPTSIAKREKNLIDLPFLAPTRNASIRIRWMGDITMSKNHKREEGSEERVTLPQPTKSGATRGYLRPDVWATPTSHHNSSNNAQKTWRVKRVWNNDPIDEREQEYEVHYENLMDKVKELLGVPRDDKANKVQEYDPGASQWNVERVYDVNGQVKGTSRCKDTNEAGVLKGMEEVSDLAAKWSYCEGGDAFYDENTEWEAFELVPAEEHPPGRNELHDKQDREPVLLNIGDRHMTATSGSGDEFWTDTANCREVISLAYPGEAPEYKVQMMTDTPSRSINKKERRRTNEDDGPQSIFDLLSPPPVYFWGLDEADLLDMGLVPRDNSTGQER
jgi:hypothetical protein